MSNVYYVTRNMSSENFFCDYLSWSRKNPKTCIYRHSRECSARSEALALSSDFTAQSIAGCLPQFIRT